MSLERSGAREYTHLICASLGVLLLVFETACTESKSPNSAPLTLRVGLSAGQMGVVTPQNGIGQILQNLSMEGLVRIGENGRPEPWLAASWTTVSRPAPSITIELRPGVKFHDGVAASAKVLSDLLKQALPRFMGPAFEDVRAINPVGDLKIQIDLRRPSQFLLEALEVQVRHSTKPGASSGTGPFVASAESANEMVANDNYYLGHPTIQRIVMNSYPSVRAAWAELLRDHLDMLYEVGVDALDSLERATTVSVFPFTRRYQYMLIFNTHVDVFKAANIRRALSMAVDRTGVVHDALGDHGIPSIGPVWPHHWAFRGAFPTFKYDPAKAAGLLSGRTSDGHGAVKSIKFTCLVPPDYERIALVVKRQLEAVGAQMTIEERSPDKIEQQLAGGQFDAVLTDAISGPSLFRPYLWWYSGAANPARFSSRLVDEALDRIRHAESDEGYASGVAAFEQAVVDDPPAIFLAWSERARAVSKRFVVPPSESGRDVLASLRLWKAARSGDGTSRN